MGKSEKVAKWEKVNCAHIWQRFFAEVLPVKISFIYFSIRYSLNIKFKVAVYV